MTSFHLGNEYVVLGVVWVDLLGASETVIHVHDCKTIGLFINFMQPKMFTNIWGVWALAPPGDFCFVI